ncbi:sodium-dependent transporter [candidate division KSB1 bacterium]
MKKQINKPDRETFSSNFGLLMTMIGVAVGLGNIWRFPYMAGKFGGAAFVLFYLIVVIFIGIPALMAEWTLGRYTGIGTLGAFKKGGLPGGKFTGYFLFAIVFFAVAYYSNTLGWVLYYAIGELTAIFNINIEPGSILPPNEGFNFQSRILQVIMTSIIVFSCGFVLIKGLRKGIERISKIIIPALLFILIILIIRSVTLENAGEGLKWYIGRFRLGDLTGSVMAAGLGQAVFSMSLGGTFMIIYGSYLDKRSNIPKHALFTGIGDAAAGLLAGLAIFPAVFAFGFEPDSGPSLIFQTLPKTFESMPAGWLFGFLFFTGLLGAAFLSAVAAFEVLVGGLVDNRRITRKKAVFLVCSIVLVISLIPMTNMKVFVPWDLIFGSGMQTLGAFLAVITTVWCIKRADALKELSMGTGKPFPPILYWWMRIVIPLSILFVGINWLLDSVFEISLFN